MVAVSAGFGANRFGVEAAAEVEEADVLVISAEVAGALSFSWGFPRFANIPLEGPVVGGADATWLFPRFANILGAAVGGVGASWGFPRFANMLVAGAVVEGPDVPELAGLLRNDENPDPLVDCVVGGFVDDCPPRLNIDFGGSFCCGFVAVLFPVSWFLFKLLKIPPLGWGVLLVLNRLEPPVFGVDAKIL